MVLRLNPDTLVEVENMSMSFLWFLWFQWKLIASDSYIPEGYGTVFRQHKQTSPSVGGRLDFDYASEQKRE